MFILQTPLGIGKFGKGIWIPWHSKKRQVGICWQILLCRRHQWQFLQLSALARQVVVPRDPKPKKSQALKIREGSLALRIPSLGLHQIIFCNYELVHLRSAA